MPDVTQNTQQVTDRNVGAGTSGDAADQRVREIEARANAAADGPWSWSRTYELPDDLTGRSERHWCIHNPEGEAKGQCIDGFLVLETTAPRDFAGTPLDQTANFAFIAHAREDIPFLLADRAALAGQLRESTARERALTERAELAESACRGVQSFWDEACVEIAALRERVAVLTRDAAMFALEAGRAPDPRLNGLRQIDVRDVARGSTFAASLRPLTDDEAAEVVRAARLPSESSPVAGNG